MLCHLDLHSGVDMSLLVTFKRLESLSTDYDVITTALSKCTANIVEVGLLLLFILQTAHTRANTGVV